MFPDNLFSRFGVNIEVGNKTIISGSAVKCFVPLFIILLKLNKECLINFYITVYFYRIMNTIAVILGLIVMVTVASGLGYNTYPSVHGNVWGSLGSRGGSFLNGGWNLGHLGSGSRGGFSKF